jgi:enoyl-CoA hydratase
MRAAGEEGRRWPVTTTTRSSDYEAVLYEKKGATAYVTLNRPNVLNALNQRAIAELTRAFLDAQSDPAVRGGILTGAGDRAFIAGADISELARTSPVDAKRQTHEGQALFKLIEALGKPVVAAVNGLALGGGCEAAMACTLRIAAANAKFGQPEVKLGLIPGFGGTQRLPRLVGKGRALQLILTGEMIAADEAYWIGLVNEVVEPQGLIRRAEEILAQMYANAPLALEAVDQGLGGPLAEGLAVESALFSLCASTHDKAEGTTAFMEKRKPVFEGR